MGGNPIRKHFSRKLLLFASLMLAFSVSISDTLAANIEVLSKLEKWLFFATFADEPEEKRISRLEDKVFGEQGEGTLDERLNKLDQVLSQRQQEKDDKTSSASSSGSSGSGNTASGSSGDASKGAESEGGASNSGGGGNFSGDFAGNTREGAANSPPRPLSEDQIPDFPASSEKSGKNPKNSKGNAKGDKKIAQTPLQKVNLAPVPSGTQSFPAQGAAPAGSNNFSTPQNQPQQRPAQGSYGGAGSAPSAGNSDAERQRIAVQAAREQEMQDLLQEGARLWRNRHGVEAVERFEQVLRLDPQNAEAHFSIGVIQESLGKYSEALAHYQSARKSHPDNQDYDDAVDAVLKKLQSQRPATATAANKGLFDQATAAFKRGEYFSALDLFKQADAKTPNQPLVKYNLGSTYLMLKDHFNALENFKLAKDLEPTNERFNRAFNELSAEMRKNQVDTQAVEQEYGGSSSSPISSTNPAAGKKPTKSNAGSQQNSMPSYSSQQSMQGQSRQPQQQPMPQQNAGFNSSQGYPQGQPYNSQGGGFQQGSNYGGGYMPQGNNPYAQNPYGGNSGGYQQQGGSQYQSSPYQGQPSMYQQAQQQQYPPMGMNQQMGMQGNPYAAPMQQPMQSQNSSQDLATTYGMKVKAGNDGCEIVGIRTGSRAAQAGLQLGDVIRTADGNEVMQPSQLNKVLQQLNSTQRFPMLIFRNGNIQPIQF